MYDIDHDIIIYIGQQVMTAIFAILPRDVLEHELRPRLDDISLLCLRVALHLEDLPDQLNETQQIQVASNGLSLVKFFDREDLINDKHLCYSAMRIGSIEILEYIVYCERPLLYSAVFNAARYGHVHCLQWWLDRYHTFEFREILWLPDVANTAIEHNQIECLKFTQEHGLCLSEEHIIGAMMYGQLDCLKYIYESGISTDDISYAAHNLPCLRYLIEKGLEPNEYTLINAAECGNIECMKLLHNMGVTTTDNLCELMMTESETSVETMQYAMSIGHYLTESCMIMAVEDDNLELVKFLIANDCPKNVDACSKAAHVNNLEMLKLLHEHGFPWNSGVCSIAAINDNLEMLQYAFEQGLAWTETAIVNAYKHGCTQCLQYLIEHGCPCPKNLEAKLGIPPVYDSDDD